MPRPYILKKRAEQQAQTRRRIVEAAVDLHSTIGPAATTFTMVADRAGVQRHTLYAHFSDERSLFTACSGLVFERDPPPNPDVWRDVADRSERLGTDLRRLYDWYERNASLMACVLRDAEHHALTREVARLRFGPYMLAYQEVLGASLTAKQRAMLQVALSFFTWRTLVRQAGVAQGAAVRLMVRAIEGAKGA